MAKSSTLPTVAELMQAGAHFGHKKHRSHPASRKYVFTVRDRVLVINLESTVAQIEAAAAYLKERAKSNALMLFVGTKRQATDLVKKTADMLDQPYVSQRWLGGTLTNFETIQKRLKRLRELETLVVSDKYQQDFSKKERVMLDREFKRLNRTLGGMKKLTRLPDVVVIIDTCEEANALAESTRMHIPVVAIVDTNANPDAVLMPIVANDDSAKTLDIIMNVLTEAVQAGRVVVPKPVVAEVAVAAPVEVAEKAVVEEKPAAKAVAKKPTKSAKK